MKRFSLKNLCAGIAMLGMMTMTHVAVSWETTSGNVCQTDNDASVSYYWNYMNAHTTAYVVCPVQLSRTVGSVQGNVYVYNPSGSTTAGYMNFILFDGNWSTWSSYRSTDVAGNIGIGNFLVNGNNNYGYITFDMNVPAGGSIYGIYTI